MRALVLCLSSALVLGCGGPPRPVESAFTLLPPGSARFIIGGDSRDDAAHVLPWAFREAKARGASAFLFLGDMELSPGFDGHFERELRGLDPVPFYPALGNHEVLVFGFLPFEHKRHEQKYRAHFLDTPRTPVRSSLPDKVVYSVDLPAGVHFVALDNVSQRGFGADQLAWLASDLETARGEPATRYIVVGMHKPLAKNGVSSHGMDSDGAQAIADSDAALGLFVKHHVNLIVASHVHEFAECTQEGIPTYITGGLGAPLTASAGPEHAFHHFLQLDVTDAGIHVTVVRFDGKPSLGGDDDPDDKAG
jgi:calcineurin-like phosphoesterase family protein